MTAVLGFALREAWRRTEEERFRSQLEAASARAGADVEAAIRELPALVSPLCAHDPVLDSALVDLRSGSLSPGQRLALSLRVPEIARAFRLDELVLLTSSGEVLGVFGTSAGVGTRDPELARSLRDGPSTARLRERTPLAIEAHCSRSSGSARIGLHAARHLRSLLDAAARAQGLELSLTPPENPASLLVREAPLPGLPAVRMFASRSRIPLTEALQSLDDTVVWLGAFTILLALVLTVLLSRGLARPIVELSEQARRVVTGAPVRVKGRGGRELEEFASAFNQTIEDLVALRKRLATTERIAARREIARRVAHEIKNPLVPIRAAIETLRRLRARNDPEFEAYFEEATRTVLGEVTRITHIVQEFTRFARLPPPNPAPMNLLQAAEDVVTLHSSAAVPVRLSAGAIPEIVADRDQMVQVLTNLVQNALDAALGAADPWVEVDLSREGDDRVRVIVRDGGPGLPASVREHLFEPYVTTKEHGTGLGLAIVQRIVFEHGGEIAHRERPRPGSKGSPTAHPTEGAGTVTEFVVTLPISGPPLLAEPPEETESPPSGQAPPGETNGRTR